MPAELSLDDELSDHVSNLRPLVARAARGQLTEQQGEALIRAYDQISALASENASAKRAGMALIRRGRTRHTEELVRSVMRLG